MLLTHKKKANLVSSSSEVDRCWSSCMRVYECVCSRVRVEEPISDQDTAGESRVEGLENKETEIAHLESRISFRKSNRMHTLTPNYNLLGGV